MFIKNTPKSAIYSLAFASIAMLGGCANMQNKQAAAPAPDTNALAIVKQVKQQPSVISGGGMIYELFVGNRFTARYSEQSKELKLTDFTNSGSCEYDAAGMLKIPADAKADYPQYCSHLSNNAIDFLTK